MISDKILEDSSISVVGGGGHIGLPLSCFLQNSGFKVLIIDSNTSTLNGIKNGVASFYEDDLSKNLEFALKRGLKVSSDIRKIKSSKFVFVTIGTSSKVKTIKQFDSLINEVIENMENETVLILRSTITITDLESINKNKKLQRKKISLAYCPERIAEGEAFRELVQLPQIVGSENKEISEVVTSLFRKLNIETIQTSLQNAVFTKLFSNAYRHANFSLVNEFSNIAFENNINFNEIVKIASKKYPRLKSLPFSSFVGGPCLPKDLETFIKSYGVKNSPLNRLENVNEIYLNNIVKRCQKLFTNKKIIQLGIGFKINSDDTRGSGAVLLYKKLIKKGFDVYPVDPLVNKNNFEDKLYDYKKIINKTNNVLIAVDHDLFKNYKLKNKTVLYADV